MTATPELDESQLAAVLGPVPGDLGAGVSAARKFWPTESSEPTPSRVTRRWWQRG